ncbi:MAG: hypothetical protein VX938_05835, partial [Myxococcota bacterium]|nr:hypothetical protein [Myxococcota bacterium]
ALVHLRTGDVHLRGLERIRTLTLTGPGQPADVGPMPKLTNLKLRGESPSLSASWPELPSLTDVVVTQAPLTSLDWLNAPNLRAVDLKEANLENCEGFGHTSVLSLPYSSWSSSRQPVVSSLRGLENNEGIRTLDVRGFDSGTDLSVLSTLRSLESIEAGSNIAIQSLRETSTVTWLSLEDYQGGDDGSLAFLAGWSALKIVVLLNSGTLTDLEALEGLPNLETIQLRGSSTKRPQWPDALQDKLDFTSGSWTYRNPVR